MSTVLKNMISVIIPVHNGEQNLKRCLNSVMSSVYSDLEIILIENGSTDNTLALCNEYVKMDSRVKLLTTEKRGVSHARNLGLSIASGEYVAFVDADDYISPCMYDFLLEKAQRMDCEMVFCDCIIGSQPDYRFVNKDFTCVEIEKDKYYYHTYMKSQTIYSVVWNKLISRKCIGNIRFDETLEYTEDRNFISKVVSRASNIIYINIPLYYYWRGAINSICLTADIDKRMDQVYSLQRDYQFFRDNHPYNPLWQDFVNACLMQSADFRLRQAKKYRQINMQNELKYISKKATISVLKAKYLPINEKIKFLLEHYFFDGYQALYKLKEKWRRK